MKVNAPACTPRTAMASPNVQENDNAWVQAADWVTFSDAQGPEIFVLKSWAKWVLVRALSQAAIYSEIPSWT